ncbi:MAG: META domain-containing protein [Bacteroidota bacterium]
MKIYYCLVLFLLSVACVQQNVEPEAEDIYGLWRYQSGIPFQLETEENPLAYLNLQEVDTLSGFSSRNILSGSFDHDVSGNIELNALAITKVADTPWSIAFQEKLDAVTRYELQDNQLILTDQETDESLIFLSITENTCQSAENNASRFKNRKSDEFDLVDINVLGTCLEARIVYGGGCGGMKIELVGSGGYDESLPPQLSVRLIMDDNDNCEALVRENVYFDLSDLQYEGAEELLLNIEGWEHAVLVQF